MLVLNCPHCGPRNVSEFRHGGEVNPRPKDPSGVSDQDWADYLYMRQNALGVQTEWWYHRAGCGRWFLAERHTLTNEVLRTYLWQRAGISSSPPAPPAPLRSGGHGPLQGEGSLTPTGDGKRGE